MKALFAGLVLSAAALSFATPADAKGCIKGALIGGIAGHMAGHGKVSAAAGCAIGHHNASKKAQASGNTSSADKK